MKNRLEYEYEKPRTENENEPITEEMFMMGQTEINSIIRKADNCTHR